jgi:putative glutamine amidotransferase
MPARMDPGTDSQYLSRQYADAVAAAGGVPLIFPLLDEPAHLLKAVEQVDGILLTGSASDIDPKRYGANRETGCGPTQPLRDETDFTMLEVAFEKKIPVFGICFGMQSVNVFLGGSLIQDIPSSIQTNILHDNPGSEGQPSHEVLIDQGSILESLAGGNRALVNSTHHQAVERIGSGLVPIARAPDGIVEAVVAEREDHFVLAVQWHPEKSFGYDPFSKGLFDLFLSRCRREANNL